MHFHIMVFTCLARSPLELPQCDMLMRLLFTMNSNIKYLAIHYEFCLSIKKKCLNIQPFTLSSSGVIVAHLTPTLYFLIAMAESMVT